MLSKFFIQRSIFVYVISIVIVLLGAVTYFRSPMAQDPDLGLSIVRAQALYPGADARTVSETVASPVEQQVNRAESMICMASASSDGR